MQQLRVAIFIWHKVLCEKLMKLAWKKHERIDTLRLALRCLPASDIVPSSDITEVFLMLADNFCTSWQHAFFRCHHLTNYPVIKSQWLIVTWLNVTKPGKWLIVCVMSMINCRVMNSHQTITALIPLDTFSLERSLVAKSSSVEISVLWVWIAEIKNICTKLMLGRRVSSI